MSFFFFLGGGSADSSFRMFMMLDLFGGFWVAAVAGTELGRVAVCGGEKVFGTLEATMDCTAVWRPVP